MQSFLVRPYVLECLNKFTMNDKEEETKTKNPTNPKPEFFDKRRTTSKHPNNTNNDIDDHDLEDTQSSSDDESSSSEDSDSNVKSHANMSMRQV